jgi:hypothetical protein
MHTIRVNSIRFHDLHIGDLFGRVGVYVIWDARAKARPTYIGEGNILTRFADHSNRDKRKFARPLDGYVALLGDKQEKYAKFEGKAVERLLLDVAKDTDREPTVNINPGAASVVGLLCETESTLRIVVQGCDPFFHPGHFHRLEKSKEIKAWLCQRREYEMTHDWRLRRLRTPIL